VHFLDFFNIESVETGMSPGGSLPNHEKSIVCDGTPPHDLSDARQAGVFELFVPDPLRGRSFGGGGDHRKGRNMKKISYRT